jgi:heat-inducible transcriptional repressor
VAALTDREKRVLVVVIRAFLATGNAVASRQVAETAGIAVSAATIRNTMLSLERRGLLEQPHTSAGRRPTLEALRIYAQELRPVVDVPAPIHLRIREAAKLGNNVEASVRSTTQVLGAITQLAGLASAPDRSGLLLAHVRLLPLSGGRVLALLVTEDGSVTHRHVEVDEEVPPAQLRSMENYLGEVLAGLSLHAAVERVSTELQQEQARYDELVRQSLQVGQRALTNTTDPDVLVEGEGNLLALDALDANSLHDLSELLREKGALLRVLDGLRDAAGTQVVIGVSGDEDDDREGGASLILAPYEHATAGPGWVGVLGPVRMPYADIIPVVEAAAAAVAEANSPD